MALRGYKPKWKKALWTQSAPAVETPRSKQIKEQRTGIYRRICPVRKARQKVTREYSRRAREVVKDCNERMLTCPVFAEFELLPIEAQEMLTQNWLGERRRRSNKINEIHHTHGRRGRLLTYEPWWLPVSKWGHRVIHAFPDLARAFGWLCSKGQWETQPPL